MYIIFAYNANGDGERIAECTNYADAIARAGREMDSGQYDEVTVEIERGHDTGNYDTVYTA